MQCSQCHMYKELAKHAVIDMDKAQCEADDLLRTRKFIDSLLVTERAYNRKTVDEAYDVRDCVQAELAELRLQLRSTQQEVFDLKEELGYV